MSDACWPRASAQQWEADQAADAALRGALAHLQKPDGAQMLLLTAQVNDLRQQVVAMQAQLAEVLRRVQ